MLARILKNMKWFFDHPPVGLTNTIDPTVACTWCGNKNGFLSFPGEGYTVCHACLRKALEQCLGKITPTETAKD